MAAARRAPAALVVAAAFTLVGGASGCCACAQSATFERRDATATGAPVALAPPVVRVLHFGDFGDPTCQQASVAAGIAEAQRRAPFDLAFSAGDNLYDCGPDWRLAGADGCAFGADGASVVAGYGPPWDPAFGEQFEDHLGALWRRGTPIYLALGNHDVATWTSCLPTGDATTAARTKACLEVAHATPAWRMPARHYVVDVPEGASPIVRFIVLDSNVVRADYGGFTLADEAAFLASATVGCDALPCFVVAHHPPATAGRHSDEFDAAHTARMAQLVAAANGTLRGWLAGHDHDLQHLRTAGGLDVFVSGNGSRDRTDERFASPVPAGATLRFGAVRWGWAVLEVSAGGFTWRAEDERGAGRYCCAATHAATWSPCEPVRCD
jgi:hypothetical protein